MNLSTMDQAFNNAVKLALTFKLDTLVWRQKYLNLPKQQKDEIKAYVSYELSQWESLKKLLLYQVRSSEFTSDYYSVGCRPTCRGPYAPAAVATIGGLMALLLEQKQHQ